MRLTCPNCGAEYEVPDQVIPTTGRDVQCSNCGDTWYQYHPDYMPDEAPAAAMEPDAELSPLRRQPDPPPPPLRKPEPEPVAEEEDDFGDEDEAGDDADADEPAAQDRPTIRRRPLPPQVKTILKEEAEIEERHRASDSLESQPELGLSDPVPPPPLRRERAAESRLARLRDQTPAGEDATEEPVASRRNLLPDIEEINSTLRRKGDGIKGGEPRGGRGSREAARETRRGFRSSFMLVLLVLIVGAVLYIQAPRIAEALPPLAGTMEVYVDMVDRGRVWLDAQASALAAKLDDVAAPETAPEPAPESAPAGN
ncbi:hypothetical protein GCM10011360_30160 [Primorskyibacter flagellatus]|uniref:Zinc finger/thioredoxin putative domain-containing protein n=1 Tax=Primorskyibacter flagellatus TaxID=1387277 RepID=A0A917ABJ8_9RHOB|nr:zinc-ribbon domain-containing protein [Primorskyibacter flagellatus]GGE40525.1 hypothetical protein GCM10011360_30160 [Primorskyibacter flagellatus]